MEHANIPLVSLRATSRYFQ